MNFSKKNHEHLKINRNFVNKQQLKNYLKIFVLLFGVSILLWNCEKEENLFEGQTTTVGFKVYSFDNKDIPQIASKIEQLSSQKVFTKNSDNNPKAYWVDDVNIFGAIDSVGNKSFSYRLYFNNMPKNTFYNIIVSERVSNEIAPFVIAFEIENNEKKSIRYYGLEYFLDALTKRDEKSKNGSYSKNDHTNDGILDFTDCGELTSGSSGGDTSTNSGSGGTGSSSDPNASSNSGNYTSTGSYTVYNYGGGGGSVTIQTGNAEIYDVEPVDAKSGDDDRIICPEGEVIIVENVDDLTTAENTTYFKKKGDDPDAIPIELNDIIKCFETTGNENGYHDITIYVNQPVANSNQINVGAYAGHTFIGITQSINGNITTQFIGFYPEEENVSPNNPTVIGGFYDDSGQEYDVSLRVELTPNQFNSIIQYLDDISPEDYYTEYDLNEFNCSDFGLTAFNLSGSNVPDSTAEWGGEYGYNLGQGTSPALLGQDIRNTNFGSNTQKDINGGTASNSTENNCN